jgi:pimeloyl-ACP methyl ester carboxylesterase
MSGSAIRLATTAAILLIAACAPGDRRDGAELRADRSAGCPLPEHRPWLHFLEIDRRGEYLPATFEVPGTPGCPESPIGQIGARHGRSIELGHSFDPKPGERWPSCAGLSAASSRDALLDCQLDMVVGELRRFLEAPGVQTRYLQIYIHGGLNDAKSRRLRAERDVPLLVLDCDATGRSCRPRAAAAEEAFFPLYIAWPSGGLDTYSDSIASYDQGSWDTFDLGWPFRLIGDLGTVIARAPLNYVKSFRRWAESGEAVRDGETETSFEDLGCPSEDGTRAGIPGFHCERTKTTASSPFADIAYGAALPVRIVSVPLIDPLGKTAWDSMIARTRFAFRKPGPAPDKRDGVVLRLLERIGREFPCPGTAVADSALRCLPFHVRVIGHSMGAIVASEIVRRYPALPYESIVFMGAAVSVREFKGGVEPALRHPARIWTCRTRSPLFFNLSLHPEAEMTERFWGGIATSGSLLEWIDDMYEAPGDLVDRTFGKWRNLVAVRDVIDPKALPCIYLKRFGRNWQSPTIHGGFDDIRTCARKDGLLLFIRPFYWEYEFWVAGDPARVRLSETSAEPFDRLPTARPIRPGEVEKDSDCVDASTGIRLVPAAG